MTDKESRDIDLLFEVGTMRHIPRSWSQFGGVSFANVAEHTLRVIWLSMTLAKREGADIGRVMRMALIHDVAETRTGDTHYVSRMYSQQDEKRAMADIFVDTSIGAESLDLFNEYKARTSLEAKIVKDADNLDCDLELMELKETGSTLPSLLQETRRRVFEQLYTESARTLYKLIHSTNPHRWHLYSPNRLTAGDWASKPKTQDESD
jgi:Predicted hydrolases of HD superfamily